MPVVIEGCEFYELGNTFVSSDQPPCFFPRTCKGCKLGAWLDASNFKASLGDRQQMHT